jgi:hypothetical protein
MHNTLCNLIRPVKDIKQSHYFTVVLQACDTLVLVTITVPSTVKIEVVLIGKLSCDKSLSIKLSRVVILSVGPLLPLEDFTSILLSPG